MTFSFAHFLNSLEKNHFGLSWGVPKDHHQCQEDNKSSLLCRSIYRPWVLQELIIKQQLYKVVTNCILETSVLATAFRRGKSEKCRILGPISVGLLLKLEGWRTITAVASA